MNRRFLKQIKPYLYVTPVLIFIMMILFGGILSALIQSFAFQYGEGTYNWTLAHYRDVLTDMVFLKSFVFSLYLAFTQGIVSTFLGILVAYTLVVSPLKNKRTLEKIVQLPILIPHTIVALLLFLQLTQSGLISRILYHFQLIKSMNDFPSFLFDRWGIGIILAYVFKGLPFIALITIEIIRNSHKQYSQTARNLGASQRDVFKKIILPMSIPSALSGFFMLFAYAFGAYELPLLLGPSTPRTLSVMAFGYYKSIDMNQKSNSMVINIILVFFLALLLVAYHMIKLAIDKALNRRRYETH